jgi:uncharacterized repeat protein (TIGR02543 family)
MKKLLLIKTMLLLCALVAGGSSAWAEGEADWSYTVVNGDVSKLNTTKKTFTVDDNHVWSYANSTMVGEAAVTIGTANNKQCIKFGDAGTRHYNPVVLTTEAFKDYKITKVSILVNHNGKQAGSLTVKQGAITIGTASVSKFSGEWKTITCSQTNIGNGGTLEISYSVNQACFINKIEVWYEESSSTDPSISASNVDIAYDAEDGEIAYTINNEVEGGTLTASTTATWIEVDEKPTSSPIEFICDANNTLNARTATVTLTYTYNDPAETVTKDVTITQAGNPNVFHRISDITEVGTSYRVKGTIVALNAKGFVFGDGTGYAYYYKGTDTGKTVGDMITVSGSTSSYGHIIQFPNSGTIIAEATSSDYNSTPTATAITAVPDYTTDYHLSDYFEYQGTLTKSNDNYIISVGTSQIQISYPSSAQTTTLEGLLNKTVRVRGYFTGINSSSNFTTMLESIEEVIASPQTLTVVATNGRVEITGKTLDENGQCEIGESTGVTATATPDEHYTFTSWTAEGLTLGNATANPLAFTMPTNAATLTANFTEDPKHTATFYVLGSEVGTEVVYDGEAITFPNVTVPTGYTFVGWTETNISTAQATAPADLISSAAMSDDDVTFYAVFAEGSETTGWKRVAASDVSEGGVYAIITTDGHAFNGTVNGSGHGEVTTKAFVFDNSGNATSAPEGTLEITFQAVTGGYKMYNADKGYLYASKATSGGLAWHESESDYWSYSSLNWRYSKEYSGSKYAYLRDYNNNSFRTYATNSGNVVAFAHKTTIQVLSNYCTTVTNMPVTITAAEYATYCGDLALDFSGTDIMAFTATDNGTTVKLNKIESGQVPANTPVVLYKEDADGTAIDVPVIASADAVGSNDLHVSDGTADGEDIYVLSKQNNVVGFYKWEGDAIPAGKVYFQASNPSREFLGFTFGDEVQGISGITNDELRITNGVYDLQGRRVSESGISNSELKPGLYIVNGKKVLVK